jgi:hypothetical protein
VLCWHVNTYCSYLYGFYCSCGVLSSIMLSTVPCWQAIWAGWMLVRPLIPFAPQSYVYILVTFCLDRRRLNSRNGRLSGSLICYEFLNTFQRFNRLFAGVRLRLKIDYFPKRQYLWCMWWGFGAILEIIIAFFKMWAYLSELLAAKEEPGSMHSRD